MSRQSDNSGQRRFAVLAILLYLTLAWAVRFDMRRGEQIASLVYPLDTFSMYAPVPANRISYLLLRDDHGESHRVTAFRSFHCDSPLHGRRPCPEASSIEYHYDDLIEHILSHAGEGAMTADLVVRTWEIAAGQKPRLHSDCVVSRCRVGR
ncbi:MAG TPA: hypothetical protein VEB21_21370 [Terriglobales bacterium]|nr:hypothetical protein [Terriglobales bacterium]